MAAKPGLKTSEFALSLIAMIVTVAIMVMEYAGVGDGHMAVKLAIMAKAWLTAGGYTWKRTSAKRDAAIRDVEMAKLASAPGNANAEPPSVANPS